MLKLGLYKYYTEREEKKHDTELFKYILGIMRKRDCSGQSLWLSYASYISG